MPPLLIIAGGMVTYVGIKWYRTVKIKKQSFSFCNVEKSSIMRFPKPTSNQKASDITYSAKNAVNQAFTIASVSLALATAGTIFYQPLVLASAFGVTYTAIPIWQKGYKSLFKKNRFNMIVVDSVVLGGLLITRHYFLAALINWLFYSSKKFLLNFKDTLRKSLIGFFVVRGMPSSVWLLTNEVEIEIPLEALNVGDIIVVNAGKIIPVDGTIVEGTASIDQSILTGESQPSEKRSGDQVFALSAILTGRIYIQVDKWGKETVAAKMATVYY